MFQELDGKCRGAMQRCSCGVQSQCDVRSVLSARGPPCQSSSELQPAEQASIASTSQETWEKQIPVAVLDFLSSLGYFPTIQE